MTSRWLIVGGSGMLGHALCRTLSAEGFETWATAKGNSVEPDANVLEVDLSGPFDVDKLIQRASPDVIVYAAGLTDVDKCEANEALAYRLHATAACEFAKAAPVQTKFVYISTDHLWDGTMENVSEDEPAKPLNAYARTKAIGERLVGGVDPDALILRTNFFGTGLKWRKSLSDWMFERLSSGQQLNAFVDAFFTPIAMPLLSSAIVSATEKGFAGIYHCCGSERISKFEFAQRLAKHCGLDGSLIVPSRLSEASLKAARPLDMSLSTDKLARALGHPLPRLDESLRAISFPASGERGK